MLKKYLGLFLLLVSNVCFSQQNDFVFGQLVDSIQNEPIPFATIRVKGRSLGVISNIDGTFKIPLRFYEMGEALEFSCMGYESKEIFMEDLDQHQSNIILLKPSALELDEAVVSAKVKNLSAKKIVRIAVNSISQNYCTEDFEIAGYYRDYQVRNKNYTNLNEAIIKIFDSGFDKKNNLTNEYQLLAYNKNRDFEIDSFAQQPYDYEGQNKVIPNAKLENDGGNEFITLISHDAIRNYGIQMFSFVDDIANDFIKNHTFTLIRKTSYKRERVYEIGIIYSNDHYLARGTIFINTDDYAIHKFDYFLYKLTKLGDTNIAMNPNERFSDGFKKTSNELLYHIQTEYVRDTNDKMFLNYISFYNKILIQRPPAFESNFVINLADDSFRIRLNKIPYELNKIKNSDFVIRYKGDLIPIKEFYFLEDERTFVLCPNFGYKYTRELGDELFEERENLQVQHLEYGYRNIKDEEGNKLDERKWEYLHQYREFFTQEVTVEEFDADSKDFMLKNAPLDSPLQVIYEEGNDSKYWKNTPLPILKN